MPKSIPVFQISAKNFPDFLMCTGNGKNAAETPVFAHVHINLILMCKSDGKNALGTPVFAHVHINLDVDGQERRQTLRRESPAPRFRSHPSSGNRVPGT